MTVDPLGDSSNVFIPHLLIKDGGLKIKGIQLNNTAPFGTAKFIKFLK